MTAVPPGSAVGWQPEDLPVPAEQLAGYGYVVLEELVDRSALLRRWPWPDVDQRGRLVWLDDSEQDSAAVAIDLELLHAQLYRPNQIRRRPRCGDTFAVQDAAAAWPGTDQEPGTEPELADLRELFSGAVYDISADAREAAKLAYHAGLGAVPTAAREDDQVRNQAKTLQARAARPLRPLRVVAPARGSR